MGMSVGKGGEDAPMMDMNTTPLIDVMLVLLIMFIITIPVQTHAVKIDLPPFTLVGATTRPGGARFWQRAWRAPQDKGTWHDGTGQDFVGSPAIDSGGRLRCL